MKAYEKFGVQNSLHNIYDGQLSDVPKRSKSLSFIFGGQRFLYWQGYVWVYLPNHPRAFGKYVKVCVLNLEEKLGRPLRKGEFVHHIDEDRINDSRSNPEPSTRAHHYANHRRLIQKTKREVDPTLKAKRLCAEDVRQIRLFIRMGQG